MRPCSVKAMAAENIALRQQLIVVSRGRKRSPDLNFYDRLLFAFFAGFLAPSQLVPHPVNNEIV